LSRLKTKRHSRDEAPHFQESDFTTSLLSFNDADEVSCRAGAIKCSRCRASFAPIHSALADGIWFPRWNGHSPSIKRNKELEKPSDRVESQSSQSWPRNNLPLDKCTMDSHTR